MSFYGGKYGAWTIYSMVDKQPVAVAVVEEMELAAKRCEGDQRFTFWPCLTPLREGIEWFSAHRRRDAHDIPIEWHILSCGCLMYGTSMMKICDEHVPMFTSDFKSLSIAEDNDDD